RIIGIELLGGNEDRGRAGEIIGIEGRAELAGVFGGVAIGEAVDFPDGFDGDDDGPVPWAAGGLHAADDGVFDMGVGVVLGGVADAVGGREAVAERQFDARADDGVGVGDEHFALGK